MTEFKKGFMVGLIFSFVLFGTVDLLFSQQIIPANQTQQLQNEIARLNVIIQDVKAERNALVLQINEMLTNNQALEQGLIKTTQILQKAIDDNEKVNFQELIDIKWNLILPDSTATRPKGTPSK